MTDSLFVVSINSLVNSFSFIRRSSVSPQLRLGAIRPQQSGRVRKNQTGGSLQLPVALNAAHHGH